MQGIEPVSLDFRPASGAVPTPKTWQVRWAPRHPGYGRRKTAIVMSDTRAPLI